MSGAKAKFARRVSVAVLVLDDFTDQVLSGPAIQVSVPGMVGKPIRKSDGYFVFTSDQGPVRQVEVQSMFYARETVDVDPAQLNPLHPVVRIRLKPNRRYAMAGSATCLEGSAEPGSEVRLIHGSHPHPLRLLYDYSNKQREISIFDPEKRELSGKVLAIQGKDQKEPEIFRILEMTDREQGVCLIDRDLKHDYKKIGAAIYPVYMARADEQGEYFLFLKDLSEKESLCTVQAVGRKTVRRELSLAANRTNRLDLTK
jgi:hypothetical protein